MLRMMRTASIVCAIVLLGSGCAPVTKRVDVDQASLDAEAKYQRTLALEGLLNDRARVHRVSYPLLRAGIEFCKGDTRNSLGVLPVNKHVLGKLAEVADSAGITEEFQALSVAPGGPADRAGMRVKDRLVSLDGWTPATGPDGPKQLAEKATELLKSGKPIVHRLRRGDQELDLTITPEPVCGYGVDVADGSTINAFADGSRVIVTRGMMRFATTDQELSLVISHEIAHNAMGHIKAKQGNVLIGTLIEALIAGATRTRATGQLGQSFGQAFSQDFEAEADYVGLYIMGRAQIPIKDAPLFWRRMAAESPGNIGNNHGASHPPTNYRMLALDKAVREIDDKKARGVALNPELKESGK